MTRRLLSAALALSAAALFALCGCSSGKNRFSRYDDAQYAVGGGSVLSVSKIEIEWFGGEVIVQASSSATAVSFEEVTNAADPASFLRYRERDGELDIKYCASGASLEEVPQKRLVVTVPALMQFAELDVETEGAAVAVRNIRATTLDVHTRTGGVIVYGYSFGGAEIETSSGDVVLELGEGATFSFRYSTERGSLHDDFESMYMGVDSWQHGSPDFRFGVTTVSGGLYLKKTI